MKRYKVFIDKGYFPRAIWPKAIGQCFEDDFVLAPDRAQAAYKVWARHGERWRAMMNNPGGSVCLHVGVPRNPSLLASRLAPIQVLCALRPDGWKARRAAYEVK